MTEHMGFGDSWICLISFICSPTEFVPPLVGPYPVVSLLPTGLTMVFFFSHWVNSLLLILLLCYPPVGVMVNGQGRIGIEWAGMDCSDGMG